jgi:putative heme-binding domain-containing protein
MADQLIATAIGQNDAAAVGQVLAAVLPADESKVQAWQLSVLRTLLEGLERKNASLTDYESKADAQTREALERVNVMFETARRLAADSAAGTSREAAIRLLGHDAAHQDEDLQLLGNLLKADNPANVQKAALDTLKHINSPKVPALLLADWKRQPPSLRAPILEALLSREEFIDGLLSALQNGTVQRAEISQANRQRLIKHSNADIQKRAAALFNAGTPSSRADALARYQTATSLPGDATKGRAQFEKNCTPCHFLKGLGHNLGPNLAALADKPPGDFVLAIIDPNAVVEPRFISYEVETRDGRSLSGIISAETATTLTLAQAGGLQENILRTDVKEIKATGLSLMPEGFEQAMSTQDLADLIAFLKAPPAPH